MTDDARESVPDVTEAEVEALRAELASLTAEMIKVIKPFADAGESDACRPSEHPIRESNRVNAIIWSYRDTRADRAYLITTPDVRRAAAFRAALTAAARVRAGRDGGETA